MALALKASMATTKQNARWPSKMGSRTQEIIPVSAWAQPAPIEIECVGDAVHNAEIEQQRINEQQREKTEKLRRFQEDVKRRVQALDRVKKQGALEKSYRAVELERNVVKQSSLAAEKTTSRKNRCTVRHSTDLSIRHSASVNTQGGIINPNKDDGNKFEEHSSQVHKVARHARGKLMSCKLITEHYLHDDLPGGVWKVGPTMDHPASRNTERGETSVEEVQLDELTDDLERKLVHFDKSPSPDTREARISRKSARQMSGCDIEQYPTVPNIYPGVENEEEKTRTQNQRAMYRRLFMDIEREQVKENQRRREHRKKIVQIKNQAERERQLVEEEALQHVEPRDPVTGQTEQESFQHKVEQELRRRHSEESRVKQAQRSKDSERFVEALKRNLREKIEKLNIDLPPLCCCGTTVWETNPNTCANNCVFYRNPKAYTAALESLLASFDVI